MKRVLLIFAITSLIEASESTGDLVVEVHQSHSGTDLWYRVGIVNPTAIDWGENHKYDNGRLPMCDLEGDTIVEDHEGHGDLTLWYRVGSIEKKTRTINWGSSVSYKDRGRSPVVAMQGNIVVEMHQSHDGTELWYHVGILDRSTRVISWGASRKFDRGQFPSIGFSKGELNTIVEVHQSHEGANLWYHVGIVNPTTRAIDWGESHKYDNGRLPMCDLNGDTVVEVHQGHDDLQLWYRVGTVKKKRGRLCGVQA